MSSKKGKIQETIDEKMLDERKVFLWGMVDDDSAKHVIDRLLYLDLQNDKEIQLYINSPGGYVTSGFAMYDTIKSLKSPVSTICTGLAASMGSILLSVGKKGRRFIQPHATFANEWQTSAGGSESNAWSVDGRKRSTNDCATGGRKTGGRSKRVVGIRCRTRIVKFNLP